MNNKEWKSEKARVRKLLDPWIKDLGLRWYQVDVLWKMGDAEDRGDGYVTAMKVVSRWMYRTATITIWLEQIPKDDDDLEKMLVHELCHILVEPMRTEGVGDNEELVAESMARAFLWTREGAKK